MTENDSNKVSNEILVINEIFAEDFLDRFYIADNEFRKNIYLVRLVPYSRQLIETHIIISIDNLEGNIFAVRTLAELVPENEKLDDATARKIRAAMDMLPNVSQSRQHAQKGN